jgi:hypothetical protein
VLIATVIKKEYKHHKDMLTPRLTNCQDCNKIPDLLRSIDCKLAELGSNMYNNVVYMLNQPVPATTMLQLLAYKRILTYKYCNPHYAGQCSINDIAGKVIRLTAGCVSRCNEPTVCEITTCCVTIVPNPTTTTTSTSSTTTTTTSTSSTTTTTTTIYPDCRIEGCFEELTTTTTTSSTSSTTTTTTTIIVFDCIEAFDFTDPEGFPNVQTGNGTKILSNGVQLTTSYLGLAPIYIPSTPGTSEVCNGAYQTNQSGGQGALGMKGGSTLVMNFNPPINAIAFISGGYGSIEQPGDVEILSITSPQEIAATEITACGTYITSQIDQNTVNLSGTIPASSSSVTSSGVTAISPVSGNISQLKLVLSPPANELAGVVLDFYVCPGPTTTTTSTSSTSTTTSTTTVAPNCLLYNNPSQDITWSVFYDDNINPSITQSSLLIDPAPVGPDINTTGETLWSGISTPVYVEFNIGGITYDAWYNYETGALGAVNVSYGFFRTNDSQLITTSNFQFSSIDKDGQNLESVLQNFNPSTDSFFVEWGSCAPTTTTTTTVTPTTTTTTTTEVPNVKLNWDLSNGGQPNNVIATISRNGISSGTLTANDSGLILCNPGDDIEITIQTAKTGIYAFTNRATLDGTVILNDTSIETNSKLSTVSFVKSAATEDLDMKGLAVEP